MGQETTKFRQTLSGSVGAGMGALFNASGKRYYILEHRVTSQYHKAGESQPIIIDNIVLGRSPKCQIRFDDSFKTVSREHAAIAKEGENWVLVQLSQTNSTFLNGTQIKDRWYLQNGDEIQLSKNGPKLGFIVPQGEKSLVKSIGMTARLNLFRQQALRPYKTALTVLSIILVLAIGGLAGWNIYNDKNWEKKMEAAKIEQQNNLKLAEQKHNAQVDSLKQMNIDLQNNAAELNEKFKQLSNRKLGTPKVVVNQSTIGELVNDVYFISCDRIQVEVDGEVQEATNVWTGTGFLLSDGRFVTARHVIEGWVYNPTENEGMFLINLYANNGATVTAYFTAYSSSGKKLHFTNKDFKMNRSADDLVESEDGLVVRIAGNNNQDWAYAIASEKGTLTSAASSSNSLEVGTHLTILGFPFGLGANSNNVSPIYGGADVAKQGLENGYILTTDSNFDHGNSGGPVFAEINGKLQVVGIVSAIAGRNIGMIVPLSVIY